jgi:hypothetical protein
MKDVWKVFLMGVMVLSLVFSGRGTTDTMEMFELQGDTGTRFSISIESYREANGWTPVVLCFGDLEIALKVSSRQLAAEGINFLVNEILTEPVDLDFTLYEQNPARTRIRLMDESVPITLRLNKTKQQVTLFVGGVPLKSHPLRVLTAEITARGWYRLTFGGKDVHAYKTFIYEPFSGTIHAVPHHYSLSNLNLESGTLWAREISPNNLRVISPSTTHQATH